MLSTSENMVVLFIGIAMVVFPYFGPWENVKFEFSVSTQFDFYQHQGGTHVES